MKAQLKIKHLVVLGLGILSLAAPVHAAKIGASVDYPVAVGTIAQDFTSNVGLSLDFYLDPILDPKVNNFLSVGYRSFTIRADGESSYRIIPILVGLELPGRVSEELKTTFGFAVGGAITYVNTPDIASIKSTPYFAAQVRPGLEWDASKDFAITAQVPITYIVSSKPFTFLAYTLGVQINLGGSQGGQQ